MSKYFKTAFYIAELCRETKTQNTRVQQQVQVD